jgi:ATP-binding cassette subfamily B protein
MIKTLAKSIRQYKKDSILTPFFVVLEALLDVVIPILMANLIDYGIDKKDMAYVMKMGGVLFFCAFLALVFGALSGAYAAIASSGFARNLRHDMFYKVQEFSFSTIDKYSTASIVTRLTTDVTNLQNAYQMVLRMAVRSPAMLVLCMIAAFHVNRGLSMVFLFAIPILGIGMWLINSNVHPIFRRIFRTYDKLNNVVQENLHAVRVVKSFTREDHEKEKFSEISGSIFQDSTKAGKRIILSMPLMQSCVYGSLLLISWLGARAIVASGNNPAVGLSTGGLLSLITYSFQILMSLMMISMFFVMIVSSRASAERITEILQENGSLKNSENPVSQVKDGSVSFENVTFYYGATSDRPVLNHVSFSINSGETIGIIGGTGSSKSSLVQLIPRLYDVVDGRILVGGVDVRNYDIEALRNQVAMVLQKNVLFSGTIKDNLRWGNEHATDEEMVRACQLAQADPFIREFPQQYDTVIDEGGTNVSGGQKQRICIARALLKKPKILILDDSTSAVDTHTDALIRKAFQKEIPDTTKIIIAQRISSVQEADKILVLNAGSVVNFGNHEQLMRTCPIYHEIYESQNRGGQLHG